MKHVTILAALAGLLLAFGLVAWSGLGEVVEAVGTAGWGSALVVAARAGVVALAGLAWWLLFPPAMRPSLGLCAGLRFVREGVNGLLPVAQVGGDIVGARLLAGLGTVPALAAASVVVDVMVQVGTQFLFTLAGLAALVALGGDSTIARVAGAGLALMAPALAGFYLAQRGGAQRLIQAGLTRLAGDRAWTALGAVDDLYARLQALYARRAGLLLSGAVHLAAWLLGAAEVWVALYVMGHPVGVMEALVIESLSQAVRGAAFAVPGALGVQEGGLIVLCGLFGVPAEAALALSLVKRAADVLVGLPGLLVWQGLESGRLWRGPKHPAGSEGRGPDGASRVGPSALRGAILADGGLPRPDIRALQ